MQTISKDSHPSLYLLADHLDAALAMGEDLLSGKVALVSAAAGARDMERVVAQNRDLARFLSETRTLELALISRLLQARKWAEEIRRHEQRLKPVIQLFVAGTASLVDAAADMGDTSNLAFETGNTALSYLRSRAVVDTDAAGLDRRPEIAVSEEFLVAGRARLGTLLDLVATFLDTLDLLADLRIADAPLAPEMDAETAATPLPN